MGTVREGDPLRLLPEQRRLEMNGVRALINRGEVFDFGDQLNSAFRRDNTAVGTLQFVLDQQRSPQAPPLTNYSPYDEDLTGYELHLDAFENARNPQDVNFIKRTLDRERRDAEVMAQPGGFSAGLLAGVIDPINVIPGGAIARGFRTTKAAAGIAAAEAGLLSSSLAEGTLHQYQYSRTLDESALNIAGSTALAAVLGASASAIGDFYQSRVAAERSVDEAILERELQEGPGLTEALGQAIRDVDPDDFETTVFDTLQRELPDADTRALRRRTQKYMKAINQTPSFRLARSDSEISRTLAATLLADGLIRGVNLSGKSADTLPPVEALANNIRRETELMVYDFDQAFKAYRRRDKGKEISGRDEARRLITMTLRRGDDSSALVQTESARNFLNSQARKARTYLERFKKRGLETGVWDEADVTDFADSYFMRLFDSDKASMEPEGLVDLIVEKSSIPITRARARQIVREIRGMDRSEYFVGRSAANLYERELPVRDVDIEEYLVNDFKQVMETISKNWAHLELGARFRPELGGKIQNLKAYSKTQLNQISEEAGTGTAGVRWAELYDRNFDVSLIGKIKGFRDAQARVRRLNVLIDERARLSGALSRALIENAPDDLLKQVGDELTAVVREVQKIRNSSVRDFLQNQGLKRPKKNKSNRGFVVRRDADTGESAVVAETVTDEAYGTFAKELSLRIAETRREAMLDGMNLTSVKRAAEQELDALGKSKKQIRNEIEDIELARRRVAQSPYTPIDPGHIFNRVNELIKTGVYLAYGGGFFVSSILSDIFTGIAKWGWAPFFRTFAAMVRNGVKNRQLLMNKSELQRSFVAWELTTRSRQFAIANIEELPASTSFGKWTNRIRNSMGRINGLDYWNGYVRSFVSLMASDRLIRDAQAIVRGKASKLTMARWGQYVGDTDLAQEVLDQYAMHGSRSTSEIGGFLHLAETDKWDVSPGHPTRAKVRFNTAVTSAVDDTIFRPSAGGQPRFVSHPIYNMLGMFRSFAFEAQSRIAFNIWQRLGLANARETISMMTAMTAMITGGAMTYVMKQLFMNPTDPKFHDRPADWIAEGIDRSGVAGFYFDINNMIEKASFGRVGFRPWTGGTVATRYDQRSIASAVAGPAAAYPFDAAVAINGVTFSRDDIEPYDIRRVRRIMPYQNLFYLRWVLTQFVENPISEYFTGRTLK